MPHMAPFPGFNHEVLDVQDPKRRDRNSILRRNDLGLWNLPPPDMPPIIGYGSHHQPIYDPRIPEPRDIDPGISAPMPGPQANPQIQNVINALMGKRI